jgi:hypothetical protein
MPSLLHRYLAPSNKYCKYPNCNNKKEGRNFECCSDHHCAHFRTNITCFGVRQTDSTACSAHQCGYPLARGTCKSVSSNDRGRCDQHERPPREQARETRPSYPLSDEETFLTDVYATSSGTETSVGRRKPPTIRSSLLLVTNMLPSYANIVMKVSPPMVVLVFVRSAWNIGFKGKKMMRSGGGRGGEYVDIRRAVVQ